jgi:sensor histidine kinase YesM
MKKMNWNYRYKTFFIASGILLLFAIFYHGVLCYNYEEGKLINERFFSWKYFLDNAGIQFIILFIAILLVWVLIFILMKNLSIKARLFTHIITLPIAVKSSQKIFYKASEVLSYGHLEGNGQVWDVFIPTFFYLVIFTFMHGIEYYKKSQERLEEKNRFQTDSLKYELKAIKAQLNPHFLYNTFNTINASLPKENEYTREMIASLSDLFRYQLKASEVDSVPLEEELNFIQTYLALEKARYKDRLDVIYNIDESLKSKHIPPMLIQPLIENAIKHGIAPLKKGGSIKLSIKNEKGKLQVVIEDTGKGINNISEAISSGFGLSFTKKRLEKFYQSQLTLENLQPEGLKISFAL